MKKMNKPCTSFQYNSLVEILFEPRQDDVALAHTVFVEPHGNLVRKFDYDELAYLVTQFARGMTTTSFKRGSKVAFICKTSVKAIIACFGNLMNGYVNVIIPPATTLEEQLQSLSGSRAETLVVDTIESVLPILQNIKTLPQLRQIIVLSDADFSKQPEILCVSWKELIQRGDSQPDKSALLRQAIAPEHEAFLYFHLDSRQRLTGLMQTHADILAQLGDLTQSSPIFSLATSYSQKNAKFPWQRMLSLAPLHQPHSFIASVLLPLMLRQPCMILDPQDSWKIESLPPRKTFIIAEASFFNSFTQNLFEAVSQHGGLIQKAMERAIVFGKLILLNKEAANSISSRLKFSVFQNILGKYLNRYTSGKLTNAIAVDNAPTEEVYALQLGLGTEFIALFSQHQDMLEMRNSNEA